MLQVEDALSGSASVVEPLPRAKISAASVVTQMNPDQQRAVGNEISYPVDGPSTAQVGKGRRPPYRIGLESQMCGHWIHLQLQVVYTLQLRLINPFTLINQM
jgi:hypothetical protein